MQTLIEKSTQLEVMKRCVEGHHIDQIAQDLCLTRKVVKEYLQAALDDVLEELGDYSKTYVKLHLLRWDAILKGLYPKAIEGNVSSIKALIALEANRQRLLGLDRQEVSVTIPDSAIKLYRGIDPENCWKEAKDEPSST
jgi:hypothetical protein